MSYIGDPQGDDPTELEYLDCFEHDPEASWRMGCLITVLSSLFLWTVIILAVRLIAT